jgi:predicted AlkP superfamily pyrophosphatase or phosphodiesterase
LLRRLASLTRISRLALAIAPALAPALTQAQVTARDGPTVIVLSFDGFALQYLSGEILPHFDWLIAHGIRGALIPPFPSKTFPSHYSMATGMYPGHHGIVASQFYDPARHAWFRNTTSAGDGSWFGGEPIWVTAAHNGVRSATFFWPGSEAEIEGVRPTYYRVFDPKIADSTKVDQVAAWLRMPNEQQPRLIMAYFPGVDLAGHYHGPQSMEVRDALRAADRTLGRLLDSLDARPDVRLDLVVVSDHGMASVTPERVIYLDDIARFDSVLVKNERATASVWAQGNPARLDTIYDRLQRGLTHAHVYRLKELPPRWHTADNPRLGDLLIVADPGYALGSHNPPMPINPGEHGYDNADPRMRGILIASGARIPVSNSGVWLDNVAVYALIAELLGIPPAKGIDTPPDALRALHLLPAAVAR